jgi:hypothetical protein
MSTSNKLPSFHRSQPLKRAESAATVSLSLLPSPHQPEPHPQMPAKVGGLVYLLCLDQRQLLLETLLWNGWEAAGASKNSGKALGKGCGPHLHSRGSQPQSTPALKSARSQLFLPQVSSPGGPRYCTAAWMIDRIVIIWAVQSSGQLLQIDKMAGASLCKLPPCHVNSLIGLLLMSVRCSLLSDCQRALPLQGLSQRMGSPIQHLESVEKRHLSYPKHYGSGNMQRQTHEVHCRQQSPCFGKPSSVWLCWGTLTLGHNERLEQAERYSVSRQQTVRHTHKPKQSLTLRINDSCCRIKCGRQDYCLGFKAEH